MVFLCIDVQIVPSNECSSDWHTHSCAGVKKDFARSVAAYKEGSGGAYNPVGVGTAYSHNFLNQAS